MTKAAIQPSGKSDSPSPRRPVALTIAGFDPSSGAGITADLKVFAAHNIYGVASITALTVQSTLGVRRVDPVSSVTIRETLDCLREDVALSGIKIGMLANPEAVSEVAAFLARAGIDLRRVVLDPIMRSSSGRELLSPQGITRLRKELLAHVGWITPNLDELAVLTGTEIAGREGVRAAATKLLEMSDASGNPSLHVLVTGGHLDRPDDFFQSPDGSAAWFEGERVETSATHGTGCAFSSALLCQLIQGADPEQAVANAKRYVTSALKAAYPVGQGKGPMHHLFPLCG